MKRVALLTQYDGSNYSGWQRQKNATTVQEILERALFKITNHLVKTFAAGRTDAGVHAVGQSANFFCDKIDNDKNFLNSLNFFLSKKDISISLIKKKNLNFHSRFDAKKKNL